MVEKLIMINWGYVLILFLLGFLTYKRKSLDALGSVVMIVMGIIIIFSAGFNWLLLILIFLILSIVFVVLRIRATQSERQIRMEMAA